MKIFYTMVLILTTVLAAATGLFKILQQKTDIELFQKIGMDAIGTTVIGAIQLLSALLLLNINLRKTAALILSITFALASTAVFAGRMYSFGIVSLIFIAMSLFIYFKTTNYEQEPNHR